MSEDTLLDLQKRIANVERIIMEPVVTRKDVKLLMYFASAVTVIGILMLIGEFYLMSQINQVYTLLE